MTKVVSLPNSSPKFAIPPQTFNQLALGALVTGAMATGFSPIFIRYSEIGPVATGFWRLSLALLLLWVISNVGGRSTTVSPTAVSRQNYLWIIAAGLFFAGDTALFNWSLKFTSIANASLLANSAPVFVVIAAWLFLAGRFKPIFVVGLITALAGATILVGASYKLGLENLFDDTLALLTAILYAGYMLVFS